MHIHSKLLSLLALVALSPALFADSVPNPQVSLCSGTSPDIGVEWSDSTMGWTLELSRDLQNWAHVNASGYEILGLGSFRFTEQQDQASFYRLRKTGTSRIYVVGDSISTPGAWPVRLAPLVGMHTFSQAIGGSNSDSMVKRARGVELIAPSRTPTTPGVIHMRWNRHIADRTHNTAYTTMWGYYAKAASEPTSIEVYQHGRFLGLAKRILKSVTTDYVNRPKTISCPGHGLQENDQLTFISNDPNYPSNLAVTDGTAAWYFSSPNLPSLVLDSAKQLLKFPTAIVERRVYFAANVTTDTFELKELKTDSTTLTLAGNATGNPSIECGWEFDMDFTGGIWDVTWTARTKYDDSIWLLEVSANDFPGNATTVSNVIAPNTRALLDQMIEITPRFILVCPPSGSFADRGPGSTNWTNYYNVFMPWVQATYPNNYIDTMAVLTAQRTDKEKSLLGDPLTPRLVWFSSYFAFNNQNTWIVYPDEATATAASDTANGKKGWHTWIGPGYVPLHLRSNCDDIHPNNTGNQMIANAVAAKLTEKGW